MEHTFSEHVSLGKAPPAGNFPVALIAGLAAALFGAIVWTGITLAASWHVGDVTHVGYLALAIGGLVGLAIRYSGKGTNIIYGLLGAFLTLAACLLGELGVTIQSETTPNLDFYAILMRSDLMSLSSTILSHTSPMMFVIYAVGALAAFKLSIRR